MKTGQVFKNAFANRYEMPAQEDCLFVFCWALLCVLLAGSWPDLHCHVWGSVRLFLCPGVASCVNITRSRQQCSCSILHPILYSLQPEVFSSGRHLVPLNFFPGIEVLCSVPGFLFLKKEHWQMKKSYAVFQLLSTFLQAISYHCVIILSRERSFALFWDYCF